MRKIAICTALAILAANTASAKNDFDALLGELTFGGSPNPAAQALTLDNIAADNLAPAPAQQVSAQAPVTDPVPTPEPDAIVMPEPVPDAAAEGDVTVEQSVVSEPATLVKVPACDSCVSGCGGNRRCGGQCGMGNCATCVPHTPPNLPTSSFYEYFKSNACNCRVWDGYQNRCIWGSKHSRGECDCFAPRKKSCLSGLGCHPLGRGVCPAGSGTCNTSGCHDLPACWTQDDCAGEATCAAPVGCDSPGCDG